MDSDSSSGFSHIWPRVFHISFYVQSITERVEVKNKHGLRSALSAIREGVYVTHFVHSVFLWANTNVYSSENSHKATSDADLTSRVGQQVQAAEFPTSVDSLPDPHLPDCPVLSTGAFCSTLLIVFFCLLSDLSSLVLPVSWEILRAGPLCGFCAQTDKGILWLAPTPTPTPTQQMPNIVSQYYLQNVFSKQIYWIYMFNRIWHWVTPNGWYAIKPNQPFIICLYKQDLAFNNL